MQIFDSIIKTEYKSVVALGFFDGVHIGHKKVLKTCINNCDKQLRSVVLTFKEHPQNAFSRIKKPLLSTNKRKTELFEKNGIDSLFCVNFESVMNMSAQEFVADVLYKKLNAKCVVTGFNYHFAKGGKSNADTLCKICAQYGIKAIKCDGVYYKNDVVSSTRIRQCIQNGEIEDANAMLGYEFSIDTSVQKGNHIGTKINSPTINQRLDETLVVPKFGVYATNVTVDDKVYIGATNIGTHPTVGECTPVCETHLLDVENIDLYEKNVRTSLLHFVRAEHKFDSINALKTQIKEDVQTIREYAKNNSTQL